MFWDLNPTELIIFSLAYIIALVTRIDVSVYVPVAISIVIQLYRIARPKYAILGRMDLDPERGNVSMDEKKKYDDDSFYMDNINSMDHAIFFPLDHASVGKYTRPIDSDIICFQPQESILFQNSAFLFEKLLEEIKSKTRRGKPPAEKVGDRPWNNAESIGKSQEKPLLQAVVLDLSGVHQMDYTGMEGLRDIAVQTERYTGHHVNWYIVTGYSATVRKSLLFAGFGNQRRDLKQPGHFLSDLRHGVEEGGHIPGIKGCCSHVIENEMNQDNMDEKKDYEQVITIEQARRPSKLKIDQVEHDRDSTATIDTDIERNEELNEVSTNDSGQWCYCNIRSNLSIDQRISRIIAVHDLYPFFFGTLHDAVRAAIMRKDDVVEHDRQLDQISAVSDGERASSPATASV
jgi:sodium-independent sulfate anion transporter 11